MGDIYREGNCARKAHRVTIPIGLEMQGKSFPVANWSTIGIGVRNMDVELQQGDVVPMRLVLPLAGSTLLLPVDATFRARNGEVSGFEFASLEPRYRRTLRHFIEAHIEGRAGDVEGVLTDLSLTNIASPLEDAVNLADIDTANVLQKFRAHSRWALLAGAALIAIVAALLAYNTKFVVSDVGYVIGTLERVTANTRGRIGSVDVSEGLFVQAGTLLFRVEGDDIAEQLDALAKRRALVTTRLAQLKGGGKHALIVALQSDHLRRRDEADRAKELLRQGLITRKDEALVDGYFRQARSAHLREADAASAQLFQLENELARLDEEAARLRHDLDARSVVAPEKGRVLRIERGPGEFVESEDIMMLIDKDVAPAVAMSVIDKDALRIEKGMLASVYVPLLDRTVEGEVVEVGRAAINAASTVTEEAAFRTTTIRLALRDPDVRIPANTRVRVLIRTF